MTDSLSSSDILATIFDTQSGSPSLTQAWTTGSASLVAHAGQSVVVRVVAVNANACMPVWIDNVVVSGQYAPAAPTGLAVTSSLGTVSATWSSDPSASSYTRRLMYGFTSPSTFSEFTPQPQCSFCGLAPGITYGIQVAAQNGLAPSTPVVAIATIPMPPVTTHHVKKAPRSITCVKGRSIIHVRALDPHCSLGFTLRP